MDQKILVDMEIAAREAADNAYCPYSNFRVGSAVLANDDEIYSGCNVENSAYGSVMCSECNTIGTAIAAGAKEMKAFLIYTPTETHVYPCGNCRQVMNEVAGDIPIYLVCKAKDVVQTSLGKLLPAAFGPRNLSLSATDGVA